MTEEQKALREVVAKIISGAPFPSARSFSKADEVIAAVLERAAKVAKWTIEYYNDTGPNDEGFWEWWDVTNGKRSFKTDTEDDAKWLCAFLNQHATEDTTND